MPVSVSREGWMQLYSQMRRPTGYLTRRFTVKPGGFFRGKKVNIDIERFGEDVALTVKRINQHNVNDFDEWTTKEFTPPVYGEQFPLDVAELLDRMVGVDPYTSAYQEYAGTLVGKMARGFKLVDDKIQRGVELQASQILQTGKLSLPGSDGYTFELDFSPKPAHFVTVAASWGTAGSTPIQDIESLANLIRTNGKVNPNRLLFGTRAFSHFLANDEIKKQFDNRRYEVGYFDPSMSDSGVVHQGRIWIGSYCYDMFTYAEEFKHPVTGVATQYIDMDKVIIDSTATRYDMVSAEVPMVFSTDPRVSSLMPGRMTNSALGYDVTPNVYLTPNGRQIFGELESRPLLVPVQIDGYGCLTTTATVAAAKSK